jgi:uncharacterized membrane protein
MQRLLEIILGLRSGFLSHEGEFSLSFNPAWPGQTVVGAGTWNFLLGAAALALVVWVYRREGRSRPVRVTLGIVRGLLLAFVIALLNRPVLTLGQSRTEPSVLAVMIDDSMSMRVRDVAFDPNQEPQTRLAAAVEVLTGADEKLLKALAGTHELRFYRFHAVAAPITSPATQPPTNSPQTPALDPALVEAIRKLEPSGQSTQIGASLRAALDDLQGQRLAGVVLMTDGRDTPARPLSATLTMLKDSGVKLFPTPLGSEEPPTNIEIQSVSAHDAAFKGDIVNVKATVRATGFAGAGRDVLMRLRSKDAGQTLVAPEGGPVEQKVTLANDAPTEVELQFTARDVGPLELLVEAARQPGELDEEDNLRRVSMEVLDAKINVLYVEGYPRWEYRYIKNEMIRDASVDISCLLFSADPSFRQEGDKPITRFPENMDELLDYDVVLFGDVDPAMFSDAQLQLVSDFVSKKNGGFGMVAGPQWSPRRYRGTPLEAVLPVDVSRMQPDDSASGAGTSITQGFRPVLTREGTSSSIFRFFADRQRNERFLREEIQPLFWYARQVRIKRGIGEVLAEHPAESDPDGRKAPLLVLGHFGGGRTLFSAIDDSWRWRFYTGESVFDTYWVQQLRHLARSRKLGQRRVTFVSDRPVYELGHQVRGTLRILDPQILPQLPEQIRVEIHSSDGAATQPAGGSQVVRREILVKQEGSPDTYNVSFTAERAGRFVMKLPSLAAGIEPIDLPFDVNVPRLELAEPQVDRVTLARLASETGGTLVDPAGARDVLPRLIPSVARVLPIETSEPLWDAPLAMLLFVFLITTEWLMRKLNGML